MKMFLKYWISLFSDNGSEFVSKDLDGKSDNTKDSNSFTPGKINTN